MGRKVHPVGYRLGYTARWESTWYADRDYTNLLLEDVEIRELVRKYLEASGNRDARRGRRRRSSFGAGVSRIEIERQVSQARVVIHTARPGIGFICGFLVLCCGFWGRCGCVCYVCFCWSGIVCMRVGVLVGRWGLTLA